MSTMKLLGAPVTVIGRLERLLTNTCMDEATHLLTASLPNEQFKVRLKADTPKIKQDLAELEGKEVVIVGISALDGNPECHYLNVYLAFDLAQKAHTIDTRSVRSVEIGRIKTHRESKVDWPGPTLRCRDHYVCAFADLETPDNLADEAWRKLVNCALGAGLAAGVAAIIASPAAALPVFEAVFVPCVSKELGNIADKIKVALHTNEATSEWGTC